MQQRFDDQATVVKQRTITALVANVLLAGVKLAGGIIGSSQAVVADAIHSLSDCVSDLAVLVGVRYWSKPPDEDHPYGHTRIETLVTVIIGVMIILAALGMGFDAIIEFNSGQPTAPNLVALFAALLSIATKEILYRWTMTAAKRIKSSALYANAWHQRSDALSSIPAALAVAVAFVYPNLAFLDGVGALVVAGFVMVAGFRVLAPSINQLIDRGASHKECQAIHVLASDLPGVKEVHKVRTRYMGLGLYVDLHVLVDGGLSVREGHEISDLVRDKLLGEGPGIVDAVIHIEPYDPTGRISVY